MSDFTTVRRMFSLLVLAALALPCGARAQAPGELGWSKSFYTGVEAGSAMVEIDGRSTTMEGIEFTNIQASADDAGIKAFVGYHIIENIALELHASWLGKTRAKFDYFNPPGERGTGETTATMYSSGLSMTVGLPVYNWLLYGRGGIEFWNVKYDTRFDLVDGTHERRDLSRAGNSMFYGAGVLWNFAPNWCLRLEAETVKVDVADVRFIGLGVEARLW